MQPASHDFRLYDSNALDMLAHLLAAELARPVPGMSPLEPDLVLIPQVAMRRWLQATLAAEYGIAANLEFLTPGEFVARALAANVPGDRDDLDAAALQWQLHAALAEPSLLAQPAMQALAGYLGDGSDALRRWSLAGELAAVFEKYQAWRRDLLLRWEGGADADDAQALLWRHIASGRNHRARRIQRYLDAFEADGQPLPAGLPPRLFAFAVLGISPDVLRVLATQARVGTLHFYLPTPTRGYWGDLQSVRARLRQGDVDPLLGLEGESSLLASWGAAGRDFMALLGNYEVVHPSAEFEAYADPGDSGQPPLEQGGLGDSLLRRLQADLFHRRPPPADEQQRLPALRRDDPSLQFHACHTRLRELQVLHDQLRGLLEDPRFDPPLQPREIAVLSPDIDPYVPYLEAVFGGRGSSDALPWALADTSPLAGEPLAEVFVRLLALPVSRFGLAEVLDLLSSAPLAEASGLDAAGLERVRGWLGEAGARWGLDAGHRAAHQAPADASYTWQFALDRLLLGHALGEDVDVAGVAALPILEGGALDVLDAVLRLLQVLARYQQQLDAELTAEQWSERLRALLAALLPQTPASPASQRALERLRRLLQQFSELAERASYTGTLPASVVRAHFSALLSQADTRAPLLTGGISFGRMVPLRLLPFRVICVLGLNDGDFPRRDPAAGLSKLVEDLHNGQRRHGDRSLREDDRFLFLQLLASAQDVFYLSWIGSDARDGSVREPSALVDELVEAAAAWHAQPALAARELVVRHSLQPFAPAAFGEAGEPRRFSFRAQWHAAAQQLGQARERLPAWVARPLPPLQRPEQISLPELRRFFTRPAETFLAQRLGIRLPEPAQALEDIEPLDLAGPGLERHQLQQWLLQAALSGDEQQLYERLLARGRVPSGAFGRERLQQLVRDVRPYAWSWRRHIDDSQLASIACSVEVNGIRVHGRVADVLPGRVPRLRIGKRNAGTVVRNGLDWLLLCAHGQPSELWQLCQDEGKQPGPHLQPALEADVARQALAQLVRFYLQGLQQPLPYAPRTALAIFLADPDERADAAWTSWHGGEYSHGEGGEDSYQLVYRGRDPLASGEQWQRFEQTCIEVMSLFTCGVMAGSEAEEAS